MCPASERAYGGRKPSCDPHTQGDSQRKSKHREEGLDVPTPSSFDDIGESQKVSLVLRRMQKCPREGFLGSKRMQCVWTSASVSDGNLPSPQIPVETDAKTQRRMELKYISVGRVDT